MYRTNRGIKFLRFLKNLLLILLCLFSSNCYLIIRENSSAIVIITAVTAFFMTNILPLVLCKVHSVRLRICSHGKDCLITFLATCILSVPIEIFAGIALIPKHWSDFLIGIAICITSLFILFWNGIICVYSTSVQLGIRTRVLGIICGLIPVLNIILLVKIIKTTSEEVYFEEEKYRQKESKKGEQICKTKYPILLVHGVFFRDFAYLNYWGRIPKELTDNGCVIYYGNHQSALSVKESGRELATRIKEITEETGCKKVNVIAHSKGGLDMRYAIGKYGIGSMVASLTTINTPHKGCEFADYLLNKVPVSMQNKIADTYNSALKKLGDTSPDFMSAVVDLTAKDVAKINDELKDFPKKNIYCQSVGSVLRKGTSGKFPLNFSYNLVKYFDGANDGLVSVKSFPWGENFTLLKPKGKRGISHGDMIDLNRENIKGFDVREFYVDLVSSLREKGL